MTGVVVAVYGLFVYRGLIGSTAIRGMTWGLLVWIVAQMVVMPLLGSGFFGARTGGFFSIIDSLVGHMVYGLLFGVLAGGAREIATRRVARLGSPSHLRRAG